LKTGRILGARDETESTVSAQQGEADMSTKTKATVSTATTTSEPESGTDQGRSAARIEGKVTAEPVAAPPPPAEQTAAPLPHEQALHHASDTHDANNPPAETDVLARLRISQDFARKQGAKKLDLTIPLRNPKKNEFFRVHPTMEPLLVWTLVDEQQTFVVTGEVADSLPGSMVAKELVPAITRQGILVLWPLRVPGEHGRTDNWLTSAKEAATHAVHAWVRVQANMALGAYEVYEAIGAIPDPEWPSLSMDEIVRIAVKGRVIDSPDHPVLQKLRGEI
jgi:hypothetical protein